MTDSNGSRNLDWLISVDDHILEPPNVWVDRVPAKDRDRAPHMELDDNGQDYWVYDGNRYPSSGLSAVAGKSKEEFSPEPLPYSEMRPTEPQPSLGAPAPARPIPPAQASWLNWLSKLFGRGGGER